MLLEQLRKGRHGDIEDITPVMLLQTLNLIFLPHTPAVLEIRGQWLWLHIHAELQRLERAPLLLIQKPALLEQETAIDPPICPLRPLNRADLRTPRILHRYHLNQPSFSYTFRLRRGEQGADVDVPEGSEPDQGLEGEDGAGEDEGPFLAVDVAVVAGLVEVDGEEEGPDDDEGPDVGVREQREWIVEGGGGDLWVIYKRWRPGGHCELECLVLTD